MSIICGGMRNDRASGRAAPGLPAIPLPERRNWRYMYDTVRFFDVASVFLPDGRENAASMRHCGGVEVVEEGGDAAGVRLVHDRPGAAGGGDHVEAADALLDARD